MDKKDKSVVFSEASKSLREHLSPFAVTVIDTDNTHDLEHGNAKIFSGTLVQIGDKLLVATASHCIHSDRACNHYWILGDQPRSKSEGVPKILAAWNTPGDSPDVGILEVERSSWPQFSSKTACPLSRIRIVGIGRTRRSLSLLGSPIEYAKIEKNRCPRGLTAVLISYSTVALDKSEWKKYTICPPPDPTTDIILEYPAGTDQTVHLDTGNPVELPDPSGMSGGGLWDHGFGVNGLNLLWCPDNAFLFGIQSAWHPTERYIRGVQIIHWLRLVNDNYPELRGLLSQQFPELAS
ncbi:MAG: hypothetical protein KatS3mg105_0582 [Gemmatales bacterium]|nr:MAG: hypothetical protein KatS3mg105_0582 [Gemmatales bacterium]